MGFLINFLLTVFLSFLEFSFLPHFKILGTAPFLVIFFIILLAYFRKGFEPFFIASFTGIIFDFFSSYPFGTYLIIFLIWVALVKIIFHEGLKRFPFVPFMIMSFFAIISFYITQTVMLFLEKATITISSWLVYVLGLAVNGICAILLYFFADWYFDKISSLEHKSKRR